MRIQFLVTAHRDPQLAWRLVERLRDSPGSRVRVQWDRARPVPVPPAALDVDLRVTRRPSGWATGAQLDAELDSITSLRDESFDWLVVLTGQCSPIKPVIELHEHLERTPHAMFFEPSVVVPEPDASGLDYLQERYYFRYHWATQRAWDRLGSSRRVVGAAVQRAVDLVVPRRIAHVRRRPAPHAPGLAVRVRRHPFTAERPCRKGPDWFAFSRPVFDDLVASVARESALVRHFAHTYCPTEALFQTLLWPRWGDRNAGHNLHHTRFVPGSANPRVLALDDWDELVSSDRFFARKFDSTSDEVLARIDRELLGR